MNYLYPIVNRSVVLILSRLQLKVHPTLISRINAFDQSIRTISLTSLRNQEPDTQNEEEEINPIILRHPERDRRRIISVETSIRYLKSAAFKEAYGNKPVWFHYRRNYKGRCPPEKTRRLCIRGDVVATGNPCPICRDKYLVVDYTNIDLLKQFISPITGGVIDFQKTGVCQKQHKNLLVAFEKAKDLGLLVFDVPHRYYDYSEYKPE